MTEQSGIVLQQLFAAFWGLFDFVVPGTIFTAQDMVIGLFLISICISVIRAIFGFGGSGGYGYKSGGSSAKISEERRHDEK